MPLVIGQLKPQGHLGCRGRIWQLGTQPLNRLCIITPLRQIRRFKRLSPES